MQLQHDSGSGVDVVFLDHSTSSVAVMPVESTSLPDSLLALRTRGARVNVSRLVPAVFWVDRPRPSAGVLPGCDATVSAEVREFLQRAEWLTPLIAAACQELEQWFGPGTEVVLELLADPEDDWSEQLYVVAKTNLDADQAVRLREQFIMDWWLRHATASARRAVSIGIDVG